MKSGTYITVGYRFERYLTLAVTTANQEWGGILKAVSVRYLGIERRDGPLLRLPRVRASITSRIKTCARELN